MTDIYKLIIKLNETRKDTKQVEKFFQEHQDQMPIDRQIMMTHILALMHMCETLLERMIDHDIATSEAWNNVHTQYISARTQVSLLMSRM